MERRQEQRALEEEARAQYERKMTIYEDAESDPLDELRFPPGLERGGSESEVSMVFHSSEPTTETLVEEPDEVAEAPTERPPEKVTEQLETHEFPVVDPIIISQEPDAAKDFETIPQGPVVNPEQPQESIEEPEEEATNVGEAQTSQEVTLIPDEAPVAIEEQHPLDQEPLVPSDHLSGRPEDASDTQSEHLSSSIEFPRPHTPHPALDDRRGASPIPFPVTSDHEDQGYGTQDDEDRATQGLHRFPAKHVHWGGVEAQPAYQQPQDDEDHAEEPEQSPPFSRLLLPPPPPVPAPQRDARPERATRIPARRAMPLALQKPMRKFEQGVYTATDVRWGMALDLSSEDNRSPIAFGSHGWENQRVSIDVLYSRLSMPKLTRTRRIVGVPSLWFRFYHQERQQWHVPCS